MALQQFSIVRNPEDGSWTLEAVGDDDGDMKLAVEMFGVYRGGAAAKINRAARCETPEAMPIDEGQSIDEAKPSEVKADIEARARDIAAKIVETKKRRAVAGYEVKEKEFRKAG